VVVNRVSTQPLPQSAEIGGGIGQGGMSPVSVGTNKRDAGEGRSMAFCCADVACLRHVGR